MYVKFFAAAGVLAVGAPDVPNVSAAAVDPPIADVRVLADVGAPDVRDFLLLNPNSERDSIMPCAVKSSFKPRLQISL
jgi:hypothetical protein